ncbi:methionyl-tRNA formyltransferase [Bdellovibrio sp. NC01]|uniref:methionyl-tRNA formyltransferase n=1 Tax=Bdellovibrio sp. NC01 TaxID=2220073 RepID=UPI00115754C2|nr:formyltransferase family protein [Bdellovibrio sp. NC01]QDK37511.1 hypothetical protein DOE51_07900 [Bdellovibrio sp. NC01]
MKNKIKLVVWGDHWHPLFQSSLEFILANKMSSVEVCAIITSPLEKNRTGWSRPVLSKKDLFRRAIKRIYSSLKPKDKSFLGKWGTIEQQLKQRQIPQYSPTKSELTTSDFTSLLKNLKADLFLFVAYTEYVPPKIFNIAPVSLNIHPSLLPHYRGSHPIVWALKNGETTIGVTSFKMHEELDAGDIFEARSFVISDDQSFDSIIEQACVETKTLVENIITCASNDTLKFHSQDHTLATRYYPPTESDYKVNWNTWHASRFFWTDKISPGSIWTIVNGNRVVLTHIKKQPGAAGVPGKILKFENGSVYLATAEGTISVAKIESGVCLRTNAQRVLKRLGFSVGDVLQ